MTRAKANELTTNMKRKIFDSIDIHGEFVAVPFSDLSKMKPGEPSEKIRELSARAYSRILKVA